MAMKLKLTTDQYNALSDEMKAEYKLGTDGYSLDLGEGVYTTDKDPAALLNALEHERERFKKADAVAKEHEAKLKEIELEGLKGSDELKAHFQGQLDALKQSQADELARRDEELKAQRLKVAEQLCDKAAMDICSKLFGTDAEIMEPHIRKRMQPVAGETPSISLIDPATGSALLDQDLENFKKTISTHPTFAPKVVVTNASGASGSDGNTQVPATVNDDGSPKKMNSGELMRLKASMQPEVFKEFLETQKAL